MASPSILVEPVSIPERVWGGLERTPSPALGPPGNVSIPERVWGGLELSR